jgi:sensor histidine kinase regulating citrate/malate metabolism
METSSLWGMLVWPICAIMIFGIYLMDHRQIHAGTYVMSAIKKWNIWYLVVFLLIQIGLIIILFSMVYRVTLDNKMLFHSLLISGLAISIMMILSAIHMIGKAREEAIKNSQEYYIDDVNKLFTIIRGQRHDFLNHVQVIHSMLQRKMLTNLESYIQELVGEITHINEMMQIGHPALAALIQAKTYTADQRKIKFTISLEHMEALNLDMKSIDIVKIIGNLLDNAFEEVQLLDDLERWVELKGKVDSGVLTICVSNSGRVLSEEEKSLVYYPGYTTKHGTTHSGIGLSIVKERVDHYKGSLELDSNVMDGTSFRIQIPLTNTQSS